MSNGTLAYSSRALAWSVRSHLALPGVEIPAGLLFRSASRTFFPRKPAPPVTRMRFPSSFVGSSTTGQGGNGHLILSCSFHLGLRAGSLD